MDDGSSDSSTRHPVSQDPSIDMSASFPTSMWDRSMSISATTVRPSKKIKMTDFKERFTKGTKLKKIEMEKEDETAEGVNKAGKQIQLPGPYGVKLPPSPRQPRNAKLNEGVILEELVDSGSDKDERRSSLPC